MNKNYIIGGIVAVLVVMMGMSYNGLVQLKENVNESYAQYQNQLKRQADLIPNLAEVAKGYMNSEAKTMVESAAARAGELSRMKPSDVAGNPELQKKLIESQQVIGRAVQVTLNAAREAYPNLKAAESTIKPLMASLEGTQNRVTVARGNNQKAVASYNVAVRTLPRSLLASITGFNALPYFEAGEANQNAPKITF